MPTPAGVGVPPKGANTPRPVRREKVVLPAAALPALRRPVTLAAKGAPLAEVIRDWSEQCGANIALHPDFTTMIHPGQFPVWLHVKNMPAVKALDWLCRLSRAWYFVRSNGVWVVPDHRWIRNEPLQAQVRLVGGLFANDGRDLLDFLRQSQRIYLQNNPRTRIELHPHSGQLIISLPKPGLQGAMNVLAELEMNAPFRSVTDQLPSSILLPQASSEEAPGISRSAARAGMRRILKAVYKDAPVYDILADLVDTSSVNVGLDVQQVPEFRRRLSLSLGYVTCERLLGELVAKCLQKGAQWERGAGFWIYPDKKISPSKQSRQQAWQRVVFRSYPARSLVRFAPIPSVRKRENWSAYEKARNKMLNYVLAKVAADWNDPAYAIGYNQPTGRLLVQQEIRVHRQIPGILAGYRKSLLLLHAPLPGRPPGRTKLKPP